MKKFFKALGMLLWMPGGLGILCWMSVEEAWIFRKKKGFLLVFPALILTLPAIVNLVVMFFVDSIKRVSRR